jgi:AraC family transcriptional regulator
MGDHYNDFLGFKSSRFDSDLCTVSIVNYESAVSEEWHRHENFHLSAILKGGNLESRKKDDIQVLPGKLMIYHQGEIHRNRFTQFPSKNLNLEIKDGFFQHNDLSPESAEATPSSQIDTYFHVFRIYRELAVNDRYSADAIHTSLTSIFAKKEKTNPQPMWLKRLLEIVEDRWDEFISLDELAKELGVHPVTISKYFQKYCHCTLADYLRKVKVDRAMQFILHSNKSFTEIAFACGFSDQSHMTRLFKLYLGLNPKQLSRL